MWLLPSGTLLRAEFRGGVFPSLYSATLRAFHSSSFSSPNETHPLFPFVSVKLSGSSLRKWEMSAGRLAPQLPHFPLRSRDNSVVAPRWTALLLHMPAVLDDLLKQRQEHSDLQSFIGGWKVNNDKCLQGCPKG